MSTRAEADTCWLALAPAGAVERLVEAKRSGLERAARALCARKDAIALVEGLLSHAGDCSKPYPEDPSEAYQPCLRTWNETGAPWWKVYASDPERLRPAVCASCFARVPLYIERSKLRAGLGALSANLTRAYRRAGVEPQERA